MLRHLVRSLTFLCVAAIAVSGCSSSDSRDQPALTVFGTWQGAEADAFRAVLQQFTDETGIHVRYTGSSSFISAIRERSEEGNPPDVAVFPQPGLMQGLADSGYVLPLRTDVGSVVNTNILPGLVAAGTTDRGLDGVPVRVSVKSLVWYSPEIFEASSYEVPTTWSQLVTLSAEIDQSGITPWCMGISAGDATGWPATDWVEDIVLRQDGTDVYDAWVKGEIPFTDARIGSAIQQFGFLALTGGDAAESRRQIINTTPAEAQNPMFRSPPQCVMYKQGSFQRDNLPSGTTFGPDGDVDIFVLPGLTDDVPPPMLVGGDIAAAMTNRKETWQLLTYLATPEAGRPWADRGNYTSPNKNFDPAWYSDPFDVRMSDLLNSADVVRFDGSDLMYAPVGTDSFLDAMTIYVASSRLELAQETAQAGYSR